MVTQEMVRAVFEAITEAGMKVEYDTVLGDGWAICETWQEVWEQLPEGCRKKSDAPDASNLTNKSGHGIIPGRGIGNEQRTETGAWENLPGRQPRPGSSTRAPVLFREPVQW